MNLGFHFIYSLESMVIWNMKYKLTIWYNYHGKIYEIKKKKKKTCSFAISMNLCFYFIYFLENMVLCNMKYKLNV